MERSYTICPITIDGNQIFLLFFDNSFSGLYVDESRFAIGSRTLTSLAEFANKTSLPLVSEVGYHRDLGQICSWLDNPSSETLNCSSAIDLWNLGSDYENGCQNRNTDKDDTEDKDLYEKVFWGCNLPSVTPPGKKYEPIWSDDEISQLITILQRHVDVLRNRVKYVV